MSRFLRCSTSPDHGTSVAAIMIGVKDQLGTNGIAYDSKLVPLQNYNYDSRDDLTKEEATARCILRAVTIQEVDIILLENQTAEGSSETFGPAREAVRLAIAVGIHVISTAGNYATELVHEYEDDTGSIIVGAINQENRPANFSNYGRRISISAYGEKLQTLRGPSGLIGDFGGTSGAAPQVAATVALMLEVNPYLSPSEVRQIVEATRVQIEGDRNVGGLLDINAALESVQNTISEPNKYLKMLELRNKVVDLLN